MKEKSKTIHSFFSNETNRFYKLFETETLPCLEISGIRMHCFKNSSIKQTTQEMVEAISPLKGIVLDTCCGLGYTAIEIASNQNVKKVYTFEIDSNVLELARNNPSSEKLFSNKKIELKEGDVEQEIKNFPENYFDAILHDPPVISIAGNLYGKPFYKELFRVLKPNAPLYHYTGLTGQKSGKDIIGNTIKRLEMVKFIEAKKYEKVAGVVCRKPEK